ncbi:MAG: arginine--tRNA ligase [Nanoarchaeota archaeon]
MFKEDIARALAAELKKPVEQILNLLEVPPDPALGDFALPCFFLAKEMRMPPQRIAGDLVKKISLQSLEKVEANGPYLNFFVKKTDLAKAALEMIRKGAYGKGSRKKERVMVEYCQVNTHKAFHVGHLRGTLLGQALVHILMYDGYLVVAANYQGDIGAHVAKSLWYLTRFNKEKMPKKGKGEWLGRIYQQANAKLAEKEEYAEEVQSVLKKIEDGDSKLTKLWKETRKFSLDDFEIIYKNLDVKFDVYFFESQMERPGKEIVKGLLKKGIAKESDGALIVDLEKDGLGVCIVLKKDGTALYSTNDLALAKIKFEKYDIKRSAYVVGAEQTLYFQQIFRILELMGFSQAKECFHLPYGLVTLEGGKISSREGELITAEDLIRQVKAYALSEVKARHPDWTKSRMTNSAEAIAMGGLKFFMILHDSNKQINFHLEKALEFEGETGPYIQYTHARISSILRKHKKKALGKVQYSLLSLPSEKELIKTLVDYPQVIAGASEQYRPALLARYLLLLAQTFNNYYHETPVLKAAPEIRDARLLLITCVRDVLSSGLSLLGIVAPEEM